MKHYTGVPLFLLIILMIYASPSSFGQETKDQYLTPDQKSIHLFNLPEGISEAQLIESLSEINGAIGKIGYKGVGYQLYKVEDETIQEHRYFVEGLWPDQETYHIIHEHEAWKQFAEKYAEMWDKIQAVEIYRRLLKVDVNH